MEPRLGAPHCLRGSGVALLLSPTERRVRRAAGSHRPADPAAGADRRDDHDPERVAAADCRIARYGRIASGAHP